MKSLLVCTAFTCTSLKLITLSRNMCYHCIQVQFALFILIIYPIQKTSKWIPHEHLWRGWTFPYLCIHFLFPACHYADSGGSDSLCQSQISEDKGLQWLLLQAGSLSARQLKSHSQSHITVVLIRFSSFPKNCPAHPEEAIFLVITSCKQSQLP